VSVSGNLRLPQDLRDLVRRGEPVRLLLREDLPAVDDDVEDAARARDQGGVDAESPLQLGRETRGPRLVVSNGAVGDLDLHRTLPGESTVVGGERIRVFRHVV